MNAPSTSQGAPQRTLYRDDAGLRQAANFRAFLSKNCSSSVDPARAVVDDWPRWTACVTASK
jgi:hypothetical protein